MQVFSENVFAKQKKMDTLWFESLIKWIKTLHGLKKRTGKNPNNQCNCLNP